MGRVCLFLKVEKERVGGINKSVTARERRERGEKHPASALENPITQHNSKIKIS